MSPADGRVGERELHRRRPHRDAVPLAGRGEPPGALDDVAAARASSRSAAPGRGSASTPLFMTPAERCTATPRSTHSRQELVERLLVEQRVAAGEQERRRCRSRGRTAPSIADWFMPAPIARTTPSSRSRCERRVGAADRGLPVVVRVVDQGDVDPVEAEPLEARRRCERRTPSARVVEHDVAARRVGVEGVVPAVERLVVDVGSEGRSRSRRDHEPADLRRRARTRRAARRPAPRPSGARRCRSRTAARRRTGGCPSAQAWRTVAIASSSATGR